MNDIRLIDANAVLKEMKETYCTDCNNYNGVWCRACAHMDDMDFIEDAPTIDAIPREKWNEMKETIIEMRDNGCTASTMDACKFLTNLMEILEKEGKNDGFD
jgi:hypothetical protein